MAPTNTPPAAFIGFNEYVSGGKVVFATKSDADVVALLYNPVIPDKSSRGGELAVLLS